MKTKKLATCSIFTALVIVILLLGSLIGIGTYAGPLLAIWITLPILDRYSKKDFLLVYITASILSIIIIPDKELALFYIGFGWYPVISTNKDGKHNSIILRIIIYLLVIAIILATECFILGLYDALISSFTSSPWLEISLILAGLFIFIVADKTMPKMQRIISKKLKNIM